VSSAGTTHLTRGLLWFVGGCAITALTYSVAASRGGGAYIVTVGAILFGGLEFLYGIILCADEKFRDQRGLSASSAPGNKEGVLGKMIDRTPTKQNPLEPKSDQANKWEALVKYDAEISAEAEKLRPYGAKWIDEFGRAYFALQEDRKYLSSIVSRLLKEAKQEEANRVVYTESGEPCTEASLDILRRVEAHGYKLHTQADNTIVVMKDGFGTAYLHSNSGIQWFTRFVGLPSARHPENAKLVGVIAKRLLSTQFIEDALALVEALGGNAAWTKQQGNSFAPKVLVLNIFGKTQQFDSDFEMTQWVMREIAPTVLLPTQQASS